MSETWDGPVGEVPPDNFEQTLFLASLIEAMSKPIPKEER